MLAPLMVPLGSFPEAVAGEASAIALMVKVCAGLRDEVCRARTTLRWNTVIEFSDSGAPK